MSIDEVRKWRAKQDNKEIKTPEAEVALSKATQTQVAEPSEPIETLEDLQKAYQEKFEKPVPNNKKNDTEWIKSKLSSNSK